MQGYSRLKIDGQNPKQVKTSSSPITARMGTPMTRGSQKTEGF